MGVLDNFIKICYNVTRTEIRMDELKLKEMLHLEIKTPEYPFVDSSNDQLIGHTSTCKHSFQCGYLRCLCTNPKSLTKFCFWNWYTAGLLCDSLCTWFEPNPRWQSVSMDYFLNRRVMVERMIHNGEIFNNTPIPYKALSTMAINEYMFKPVNIFLLGADDNTTVEEVKKKWPWVGNGIGKPLFKIRKESNLELLKAELREQIINVPSMGMVPCIVLKWDDSISAEYEETVMKIIKDFESVQSVNIATRLVHSEQIQINEMLNLSWINDSIWVHELNGLFEGKPVLCIAGGPSLKDNLELIRQNQDKFIILAVSTIAEVLFKNGIIPHIIGTIDMKSHNKLYLEALTPEQMNQSHLIFEIDAHHEVVDTYKGPKIMLTADMDKAPITEILPRYMGTPEFNFPKSGTVSNMIYNLARLLKPSKIILVGYDLCYNGLNSHMEGVRSGSSVRLTRNESGETYLQFGDSQCVEEAILVPTYAIAPDGTNVNAYTTKAYYTYLIEIQARIRESGIPTYEISEKSAYKELANYVDFKDLISQHSPLDVNPTEVLNGLKIKKLTNHQVKKILKNPLIGDNRQDIKYNHVSKLTYLLRQYNQFPILKYGTVIQRIEDHINKVVKASIEPTVNLAINKWRSRNEIHGE